MQPTLLDAALGAPVTLDEPQAPPALRLRLAELGLRRGQVVHPLRRTPGGGRVIAVGTARIALDRGTCRQLPVRAAARPAPPIRTEAQVDRESRAA